MSAEQLFAFVARTQDLPWDEAQAAGLFNCPDAGGWLREINALAVLTEDRDAAVERGAEAICPPRHRRGEPGHRPCEFCVARAAMVLDAAGGER